MAMGAERSLTRSFLRHVETLLANVDYTQISSRGSRAANAYRLARKELAKLKRYYGKN